MQMKKLKANQRKLLGDVPEFMGLSKRAIGDMASESVALKTMNKNFLAHYVKNLEDLEQKQQQV